MSTVAYRSFHGIAFLSGIEVTVTDDPRIVATTAIMIVLPSFVASRFNPDRKLHEKEFV